MRPSEASLKIENAEYIVSVDAGRRIVRDGSIVVEGSTITHVGKADELSTVPAEQVIDARHMVITPGFTNGHMHVSYAHATRGIFPDDMPTPEYLRTVFRLQQAMTAEEEYLTSLLGITELLKYGVTTFLDPGTTTYLDACMEAYRESGCRIIVGRSVNDAGDVAGVAPTNTDAALAATEDTIWRYDGALDGRVRAWAMPFSQDSCTVNLLGQLKQMADAHETGLTLHQTNLKETAEAHKAEHGHYPVECLERDGLLGPNVLLAHLAFADQAEIDALAKTDTKVVLCPTAALKQGAGLGPHGVLPELLEQGVCVGLGTDAGNNSNLTETMRSMYLAATVFKDARRTTGVVTAEQALEMATLDGARALGLGTETGSIEVGKKADIVLFDTRRPEWRTLFNPVNTLVYGADGRSVHTVIVDGKIVVQDHAPTYVDEWELIQKVQPIGEDMMRRTGVSFSTRWPVV